MDAIGRACHIITIDQFSPLFLYMDAMGCFRNFSFAPAPPGFPDVGIGYEKRKNNGGDRVKFRDGSALQP